MYDFPVLLRPATTVRRPSWSEASLTGPRLVNRKVAGLARWVYDPPLIGCSPFRARPPPLGSVPARVRNLTRT